MATLEIVCDTSELTAVFGAKAPDVIIVGGYAVPDGTLPSLLKRVRDVKEGHLGFCFAPVKWNVKDLERALDLQGLSYLLPVIKAKSDALRSDLLQTLCEAGVTLFISIILAYSNNKQVLGKTKDDLVRYSFSNLLMRAGLFCQDKKFDGDSQVILDWPDGGKRHIFINEYYTGWNRGKSITAEEEIDYHCGPLNYLRFRPSLLFGVTDLDERLQLADLIVGTSRAFVNFCMSVIPKSDFGVQQFVSIAGQLDRADGWRCFGRGLTVAPAHSTFSDLILKGFNQLGC